MIIKVIGADYSACGIGKIDIPVEITDEVKNIMSTFSAKNNTTNQKALQKFFNSVSSFKKKIKVLCLPIFASTSHEAVTNVMTNLIVTEQEPGSFIEINDSGSTKIAANYTGSNFVNIVTKYNTDFASEIPNANSAQFVSFKGNMNISLYAIYISQDSAAIGILPNIKETETLGFICNEDAKFAYMGDDRQLTDWVYNERLNDNKNGNLIQSYPFGRSNDSSGCSIYCVTTGMTVDEYQILHKAMSSLNNF